jgi:hypothetical protein
MAFIFESIDDVYKEIREHQQVPAWITDARKYHKRMKALVYGKDFVDLLLQIEHIESEKKAQARRKYARSIKDAVAKILEPVGYVYSATGSSVHFNISSEEQKGKLLKTLGNVRGSMSLSKWLETFWAANLYNADPSGVIMLEWKDIDVWPTYKSIDVIRDYKAKGMEVEYILFEPKQTPDGQLWRIVDGAVDYHIMQKGDTYEVIEQFTHTFEKCPARICSDMTQFGEMQRLAMIDPIAETLEEMMRDRSVLTIYKFKNGFATPYRPKIICPTCHGTRKNGSEKCPDCDGKGTILDKDVTDEIIIPLTLDANQQPQLPTNFAGFIAPPLDIWNQYKEEETRLFKSAFETTWGTRESEEVKDQTAVGVILNTQPMISRLSKITDVAQSHDNAFANMIAKFIGITVNEDKPAILRLYGRNYIVQPPSFLLSEYQKSRADDNAISISDTQLNEYITSKYKDDPERLRVELMKKELEPYVHYGIQQVFDIFGQKEAQRKGLFQAWWNTLTQADLVKTPEQLILVRDKWMDEKIATMAILPQPINQ